MQTKNIIPIIVAVVLGIMAVFLVGKYMGKEEQVAAAQEYFLVAAQNLKKGDVLSRENVTARKIESAAASRMAIPAPTRSAAVKVYGQKVLRDIERDDFLLYTDLGVQSISPLAEAVEPGKWAVTVGVDALGGLAGLVRPGDEVVLLATLAVPQVAPKTELTGGNQRSTGKVPATFVLYPSIKVLAIGQQVAGKMTAFGKDAKAAREVTFLATPQQAQEITHVRQFGRLSLAMRRPGDKSNLESAAFGAVTDQRVIQSLLKATK